MSKKSVTPNETATIRVPRTPEAVFQYFSEENIK
jgi:hypothetical protein